MDTPLLLGMTSYTELQADSEDPKEEVEEDADDGYIDEQARRRIKELEAKIASANADINADMARLKEELRLSQDKNEERNEEEALNAAKHVTNCVCCIAWCAIIVGIIMTIVFSWATGFPRMTSLYQDRRIEVIYPNATISDITDTDINPWEIGVVGNMIGMNKLNALNALLLAFIAFFSVILATCVSTLEVNQSPHDVPKDFEAKGTLSNVSQDITEPNGRMFTVGLFTFGLLLINSAYTTWLYRSWAPNIDKTRQPFIGPVWQPAVEKVCRAVWVTVPNALFMFTAAFPSLSDADGYRFYMMITHNICAPIAMLIVVVMETTQLSYGENAFKYFFSTDAATAEYGPLSITQRARVIIVSCAWINFVMFLGIQVYLGLGSMLGMKIKKCYALALVSYYGEVIGMNLVAVLPLFAGVGTVLLDGLIPNYVDAALGILSIEDLNGR